MGVRDFFKKIFANRFGRKTLTSGEGPVLAPNDLTFHSSLEDLKVSGLDEVANLKFEEIEAERTAALKEVSENYKNTILSDATLQQIKNDEFKTGKKGETPFICVVEADENGNFKTTVIVTEKSCAKVTEDENGNVTYQETRIDGEKIKTVVNTKDTSMVITGNVNQEEIDKIKKFNEGNKKNLVTIKKISEEEQEQAKYVDALKKAGVMTDIDLSKVDEYMSTFAGKVTRDENGKMIKLDEMNLVLDKKDKNKNPLIISFSTSEKDKLTQRRFLLNKDGKYIDESSAEIKDGKVTYKELDLKEIRTIAKNYKISDQFIDKAQKINRDNVQLVPPVAKKIHEEAKKEFEKAKNEQKQKQNSETKTEENKPPVTTEEFEGNTGDPKKDDDGR